MAEYKRTEVLSYSSIEQFHKCPGAFKALYMPGDQADRIMPLPSPQAVVGTMYHDLIANYLIDRYGIGGICTMDAAEAWEMTVTSVGTTIRDEVGEDETNPFWVNQLSKLIHRVEEKWGNPPEMLPEGAVVLGVEMPVCLNTAGERCEINEAAFASTLDLVYEHEGTLFVRDHKTTMNPDFDIAIEDDFQMRTYGLMAREAFPDHNTIALELDFIRFDGLFPFNPPEFAREDFDEIWNWIANRASGIFKAQSSDDFPVTVNEFCGWCSVRHGCPEWNKLPVLADTMNEIVSQEQALKVAKVVYAADARVKEIKRMLRAFIENHGEIMDEDAGKMLTLSPNPRYEVSLLDAIKSIESVEVLAIDEVDGDGNPLPLPKHITELLSTLKGSRSWAERMVSHHLKIRSPRKARVVKELKALFPVKQGNPKLNWRKK